MQEAAVAQALAAAGISGEDFEYNYNGRFSNRTTGSRPLSWGEQGIVGEGGLSENQTTAEYENGDRTAKGNPMWDEETRIARGVTKGKAPKILTAAELLWGKASDEVDKAREDNKSATGGYRF